MPKFDSSIDPNNIPEGVPAAHRENPNMTDASNLSLNQIMKIWGGGVAGPDTMAQVEKVEMRPLVGQQSIVKAGDQ